MNVKKKSLFIGNSVVIWNTKTIYRKTTRINNWLDQGCKVQNQDTKFNSISIYWRYISRKTNLKNIYNMWSQIIKESKSKKGIFKKCTRLLWRKF